uniref:Spermatogenesis associated 6 like n=1 Tax=Jaculus jaculus TaxID=51337 RepID=A0A8C5LGB9_JACJA
MPLEVVVELQIRAISCPGVFLPDKESVYLGVYLLNQYLETDCFPSAFPIVIHQSMRFEKVFENAIDPGAVADLLESFLTRFELIQLVNPVWEELAYYEENTRDFLFPEPKLRPLNPGIHREVLMKTAVGFPGIAPKLEFSTRTAIRECVLLQRNRFLEETYKSQRPLSSSYGQRDPLHNGKMKSKERNLDQFPKGTQSWTPSPFPTRRNFLDQQTHVNFGNSFRFPEETKPPFVVRHVDSTKPFGESTPEHHPVKFGRKSKLSNFPFPVRRVSSLDSLADNIKVIKEPDERIVLRSQSPAPLGSNKSGRPSSSHQEDTDFHRETSFAISRSPSPLDLRERFRLHSPYTWQKIHEKICSLLTTHRAHPRKDCISNGSRISERQSYDLMRYPPHKQRYF